MAEPPKAKKPKRVCHFNREWTKEFPGIGQFKGKLVASFSALLNHTIQLLLNHFDHISVLVIIMLSAINILINMGLACGCGFD